MRVLVDDDLINLDLAHHIFIRKNPKNTHYLVIAKFQRGNELIIIELDSLTLARQFISDLAAEWKPFIIRTTK